MKIHLLISHPDLLNYPRQDLPRLFINDNISIAVMGGWHQVNDNQSSTAA